MTLFLLSWRDVERDSSKKLSLLLISYRGSPFQIFAIDARYVRKHERDAFTRISIDASLLPYGLFDKKRKEKKKEGSKKKDRKRLGDVLSFFGTLSHVIPCART